MYVISRKWYCVLLSVQVSSIVSNVLYYGVLSSAVRFISIIIKNNPLDLKTPRMGTLHFEWYLAEKFIAVDLDIKNGNTVHKIDRAEEKHLEKTSRKGEEKLRAIWG